MRKKIYLLILSLIAGIILTACGGPKSSEDSSLYGEYRLYAAEESGMCLLASELFEEDCTLLIEKGGKGTMTMGEKADIKWNSEGEKITISQGSDAYTGTAKAGVITLEIEGTKMYFALPGADTAYIGATDIAGAFSAALNSELENAGLSTEAETEEQTTEEATTPAPVTEAQTTEAPTTAAADTPNEVQKKWNGWWYGGIDINGSENGWEWLNGETYDVVMYVELNENGEGTFDIYDPYGELVDNGDDVNNFVSVDCHADTNYLYGDSGHEFGYEINPSDWLFVRFMDNENMIGTSSSFTDEDGNKMGYDFTFMPWGSDWEGESFYTVFLPHFDIYQACVESGMESPYDFEDEEGDEGETKADTGNETGSSGNLPALLGSSPVKLSINDRDIVYVYYPGDRFEYDSDYGKIKSTEGKASILFDPLLGDTNYEEYKQSFEKEYSNEEDYSMTETTVNGYKTLVMTYTDWLGSGMQVVVDYGTSHDGYYGMRFSVSGDSVEDCNSDLVWAVIESMEVAK